MNLTPTPSDLYGDPLSSRSLLPFFLRKRVVRRLALNAALIALAAQTFLEEGVSSPYALMALGMGTLLGGFIDNERRKAVRRRFSEKEIATKSIVVPSETEDLTTSEEDKDKVFSLFESISYAAKGDYPLAFGGFFLLTIVGVVSGCFEGGFIAGCGVVAPLVLSTYETQERWQKVIDNHTVIKTAPSTEA